MQTTMHTVSFSYTHKELDALFCTARIEDVEAGGRYDAQSAAVNIWSHSWSNKTAEQDSEPIGTLYFTWGDESCLYKIECEEYFDLPDLLVELGTLEVNALGHIKHGRVPAWPL